MVLENVASGSKWNGKRELSCSKGGSGPMNNNCRVASMPLSAPVMMVVVREEDVVIE